MDPAKQVNPPHLAGIGDHPKFGVQWQARLNRRCASCGEGLHVVRMDPLDKAGVGSIKTGAVHPQHVIHFI